MKMQFLTVAAAALMAAPMLNAQATTPAAPANGAQIGARHGHHGMMLKELNLTADQKTRIKAIHARYKPQMKAKAATFKPDRDAMKAARARGDSAGVRAARARLQADMAPTRQVREQEMNDVRAVLTPAQQQQFDAERARMKAGGKGRGQMGRHAAKPIA
ncbi:MAG: Spy/CpxP family protein refolding chaperone [Gemmatimonadota bacterium]|nr:Spy/CpxP family protein refolding chaperone [Gemmatimonadota bacterium]